MGVQSAVQKMHSATEVQPTILIEPIRADQAVSLSLQAVGLQHD